MGRVKGSYILLVELATGKDMLIQSQSILGFGSSAPGRQSQLGFSKEKDGLRAKVTEAAEQTGLAPDVFFSRSRQNGRKA